MSDEWLNEERDETDGQVADFGLTFRQCRLLLALESTTSVVRLAGLLKRDPSVISRQLKQIAAVAPVVSKRDRTWELTPLGKKITNWTRDAILDQKRILHGIREVRVAAPRAFAEGTLESLFQGLSRLEEKVEISLSVSDQPVERALLLGEADLGFDFGRPTEPVLRTRSPLKLEFVAVASPEFIAREGITAAEQLSTRPFLHHSRLATLRVWPPPFAVGRTFARFNDELLAREAAVRGLGWTVLPRFLVEAEIARGKLAVIPGYQAHETFGVWWIAGRESLKPWVEWAAGWLQSLQLGK